VSDARRPRADLVAVLLVASVCLAVRFFERF
jgi:hypothetical protein